MISAGVALSAYGTVGYAGGTQHRVPYVLEEAAVAVLRRLVQIRRAVDRHQRHSQPLGFVGRGVFGQVPDPFREPPSKRGDLFRQ